MPSLNHHAIYEMQGELRTMAQNMASITEFTITPRQVVEMLIKPEEMEVCRRAVELNVHKLDHSVSISFDLGDAKAEVYIGGLEFEHMMFPHRRSAADMPPPTEPFKALHKWLCERVNIGYKYGEAGALIDHMAVICDTTKQIKYYWPGLLQLMEGAGDNTRLGHLRDKWVNLDAPKKVPNIRRETREAIAEASVNITKAKLVGAHKPAKTSLAACGLTVSMRSMRGRKTAWGATAQFY